MSEQCKYFQKFYNSVADLCKQNAYNLVLHKHLGDVFYAIGAKEEFEAAYNSTLRFIIRPQHEFLMHMYGITDYSICDLDALVKKNKEFRQTDCAVYPKNAPLEDISKQKAISLDRVENDVFQALFQCLPVKGLPFICENLINSFWTYQRFWAYRWSTNMCIDENFRFAIPKHVPVLSASAQKALQNVAPINKIVLLAPEAATSIEFPIEFWNIIAARIHAHGYKIIVNSKKYKIDHAVSAFDLGLTLSDVVSLGLQCAYVFALRSGLCDTLIGAREKLYALYPAMLHREMHSLNKCFEPMPNVNEISVWRWKIDTLLWEGEDLTEPLQKHINKWHMNYVSEKIQYLATLPFKNQRNRHRLRYSSFKNLYGKSKIFKENNVENLSNKYHNIKISFLGLPLYSRQYTAERQGRYTVKHQVLRSLVQLKTFDDKERYRLRILGIPVFTRGKGKNKLFGINIHKYDSIADWLNNLQSQIDSKYDDIYILRHNIGETYVELLHLADAIKANKSRKPLLILWDKKYTGFYKMFLPKNMDMQFIDLHQNGIHTVFDKQTIIVQNNQRFICTTPRIAQNMKKLLPTWPEVNFYDYINNAAGVPKGAQPTECKVSIQAKKRVARKIKQIGLQDKFVILCPEAISLAQIKNEFWITLANSLREKGYDIFVNIHDKGMILKNCKSARMTLEEMFLLTKRSEGVITLASGLAVLLTAAGVKMDLLYTKFSAKSIGYEPALAIQIYSVHHLPGVSKSLVKEYDTSKIKDVELIQVLLNRY